MGVVRGHLEHQHRFAVASNTSRSISSSSPSSSFFDQGDRVDQVLVVVVAGQRHRGRGNLSCGRWMDGCLSIDLERSGERFARVKSALDALHEIWPARTREHPRVRPARAISRGPWPGLPEIQDRVQASYDILLEVRHSTSFTGCRLLVRQRTHVVADHPNLHHADQTTVHRLSACVDAKNPCRSRPSQFSSLHGMTTNVVDPTTTHIAMYCCQQPKRRRG
jgi:hypothetical protein